MAQLERADASLLNKLSLVFLAGAQQVQEIFQNLLCIAVMFILANRTTNLALFATPRQLSSAVLLNCLHHNSCSGL
jgi:hypothetical protein